MSHDENAEIGYTLLETYRSVSTEEGATPEGNAQALRECFSGFPGHGDEHDARADFVDILVDVGLHLGEIHPSVDMGKILKGEGFPVVGEGSILEDAGLVSSLVDDVKTWAEANDVAWDRMIWTVSHHLEAEDPTPSPGL